MVPFEAIGEQARYRVVLALLRETGTGETITYASLGDALDLDPKVDRHKIQQAVRQAAGKHETADRRALEVVPNTGYRIVTAPEHLRLADKFKGKASKALRRGRSKVVNVDLNGMDLTDRQKFEMMAHGFAATLDMVARLADQHEEHEKRLAAMDEKTERSAAETAERLARLEKDMQDLRAVQPEGTG